MRGWRPAAAGLVLAALTAVGAVLLGRPRGPEALAAILVAAGAVYPGAALAGGARRAIVVETAVCVAFVAAALIGLWHSLALLGLGYFAHAGWDLLHHPHRVGARVGSAFPPFCLTYDVVIGLFILTVYR